MNKILYKIGRLKLRWLLLVFVAVICIFSSLYYIDGIYGGGIKSTNSSEIKSSLLDCTYFSIVTFTTLGFGDYYPLGTSKLFVSIEVIVGMIFFGLMISRFTGAKSDYILHRLYASEIQKKIVRFKDGIKNLDYELKQLCEEIIKTSDSTLLEDRILCNKTNNIYEDYISIVMGLRRFLGYEIFNGEVFVDISRMNIYKIQNTLLESITSLLNVHTTPGIDLIKTNANKKKLYKTVQAYYIIANMIEKYGVYDKHLKKCNEIRRLVEKYCSIVLNLKLEFNNIEKE